MTARAPEILFVDPSVPDLETILGNLRPEVEAIVLDARRPAARQMAAALEGAKGSTPCTSSPTAHRAGCASRGGEWSAETLEMRQRISPRSVRRLGANRDLLLWSCETAWGETGDAFIEVLAKAVGADVSAATTRVGAAALGGTWKLTACASQPAAPLTEVGTASYAGVLAIQVTVSGTAAINNILPVAVTCFCDDTTGVIVAKFFSS